MVKPIKKLLQLKEETQDLEKYANDHKNDLLTLIFDNLINGNFNEININFQNFLSRYPDISKDLKNIKNVLDTIKQKNFEKLMNRVKDTLGNRYEYFQRNHPLLVLNYTKLQYLIFFNTKYQTIIVKGCPQINKTEFFSIKRKFQTISLSSIINNKFSNILSYLDFSIQNFDVPMFSIKNSNIKKSIEIYIGRVIQIYQSTTDSNQSIFPAQPIQPTQQIQQIQQIQPYHPTQSSNFNGKQISISNNTISSTSEPNDCELIKTNNDLNNKILNTLPNQIPLIKINLPNKKPETFDLQEHWRYNKQMASHEFLKQIENSMENGLGVVRNSNNTFSFEKVIMKQVKKVKDSDNNIEFKFEIEFEKDNLYSNEIIPSDFLLFKISREYVTGLVIKDSKKEKVGKNFKKTITVKFGDSDCCFPIINKIEIGKVNPDIQYVKINSGITFKRELEAISKTNKKYMDFILSPKYQPNLVNQINFKTKLDMLNPSQIIAIKESLSENLITLIEGPPGTGKTTVIEKLISIIHEKRSTVLVCAPSHTAVNEILKRIYPIFDKNDICRVGRKEKIPKEFHDVSPSNNKKFKSFQSKKLKVRNSKICLSTSTGSGSSMVKDNFRPDYVIIDESTQSTEPSTLIPMSIGGSIKAILVGDIKQLPPTIFSEESKKLKYNVSLFERLSKFIQVFSLNIQYRMHQSISKFPSEYIYNGSLEDGENVKKYKETFYNNSLFGPIKFYDVSDSRERFEENGKSKMNQIEIDVIVTIIKKLLKDHPELVEKSFGIITPYKLQKQKILERIQKEIKFRINVTIKTIDGSQGGENDIVILSCVSSQNIGFFKDKNRINVSITRAKYGLFIVGNKETFIRDETWKQYIACLEKLKAIKKLSMNDINQINKEIIDHSYSQDIRGDAKINENQDNNTIDEDEDGYNTEYNEKDEEYYNLENYQQNQEILQEIENIKIKDYFPTLILNKKLNLCKILVSNYIEYFNFLSVEYQYCDNLLNIMVNDIKEDRNTIHNKFNSLDTIKKKLKNEFNNGSITPFGSFLIGISSKQSEIDVNLEVNELDEIDIMERVKFTLERRSCNSQANRFEIKDRIGTIVPVIDTKNNAKFNLYFNNKIASDKSDYIKKELNGKINLINLIILVKYYAEKLEFNNPKKPLLSSHALTLMAIYYFKNNNLNGNTSLFKLLHGFYIYYIKFNYDNIISITNESDYHHSENFDSFVKIQDIIDQEKNVSRGVELSNYKEILVKFCLMEYLLRYPHKQNQYFGYPNLQNQHFK